jgi:hypothetical protein
MFDVLVDVCVPMAVTLKTWDLVVFFAMQNWCRGFALEL